MTENLIAEIERLCDETDTETNEPTQAWLVGNLRAAIARQKAHTPTDDERKMQDVAARMCGCGSCKEWLAESLRRAEVPEPKCEHGTSLTELCEHVESLVNAEPQGEPSDAQAIADEIEDRMRRQEWLPAGLAIRAVAALRAAGGVR